MNSNRLIIAVIILGVLGLGLGDVAVAAKKGKMKGKDLYKEYCKSCHEINSVNGEYTPMTLIQDQWVRFFDKKYETAHQEIVDEKHEGKTVIEAISADDLKKIRKFAIDHAADSEQPMTCG